MHIQRFDNSVWWQASRSKRASGAKLGSQGVVAVSRENEAEGVGGSELESTDASA
jgi:hypothetical protein